MRVRDYGYMQTAGLSAFDDESRATLERLVKRPFDRFNNPIFCRSCTDRIGVGYTERCPRWNSASAHICPFREALISQMEKEEA